MARRRTWWSNAALRSALIEGGGYVFANAEAAALVARFTTPPTTVRKILIDALVGALKAASVWSKLDALYIMAAHDAQAARRNWVADAYNLTAVSSPTFTTDRGYAGDTSSAHLKTGYVPSTAGGLLTVNSAHLSVWDRTVRAAFGSVEAGVNIAATTVLQVAARWSSGQIIHSTNEITTLLTTIGGAAGHTLVNRSGVSARQTYRDGVEVGSNTTASSSLPNLEIYFLGRNTSDALSLPSGDELAVGSIGASLTAGEAAAFHTALNTYLTAVGAA